MSRIGKCIETADKLEVTKALGRKQMGSYCLADFLLRLLKWFWKHIVVMVAQHCECNKCH